MCELVYDSVTSRDVLESTVALPLLNLDCVGFGFQNRCDAFFKYFMSGVELCCVVLLRNWKHSCVKRRRLIREQTQTSFQLYCIAVTVISFQS